MTSERGAALLIVLWGVVLISGLSLAILARTRVDLTQVQGHAAQVMRTETRRGAIALALARIEAGVEVPHGESLRLNDRDVTLTILSEAGRLDLNTVDPDLLSGLLAQAPLDDPDSVAAAVFDAREAAKGRAFHHSSGIMRHGVSYPAYEALRPSLTTATGRRGFDALAAPPDVLASVPGLGEQTALQFIEWRESRIGPAPGLRELRRYSEPPVPVFRIVARIEDGTGQSIVVRRRRDGTLVILLRESVP